MANRLILHFLVSSGAAVLLSGCATSAISPTATSPALPAQWSAAASSETPPLDWLAELGGNGINELVSEALHSNYSLARQAAAVAEARENVTVNRAQRLPELSLGLDAARRSNNLGTDNSFGAGLDLSWEADIWGRLSDVQRQAELTLAAREAQLIDNQRNLAGDVAGAWFNVLEARQLLNQFQQRLQNLQQDLEIINRGYELGVNDALDVYLSRSTLEQERGRVAAQRQTLNQAIINLQLLLARYPSGQLEVDANLPVIDNQVPAGIPAELLSQRADVQQAWLNLLAADAALAVAHKQRFPRLNLLAGVSDQAANIGDLFDGGLAWSLLGSATQPLFNAGRLAALEEQARLRVVQAEKDYLNQLFNAFAEVETNLYQSRNLTERYQTALAAEDLAQAAQTLAFEQYQRGLVPYTTVLESQRRAFDAQTNVIQLRNQLLQNRIDLYLALGGSYALDQQETQP